MNQRLLKITSIGILSAAAFVVVVLMRIPVVSFLKYEAKDVVIAIGGFILNPLSAMVISVISSFLEMLTVSDTGPIGLLMNVISSCAFACTASAIYHKKQSMSGAITGLICGVVTLVAAMLMWNYFITPYYMNVTREEVTAMLLPVFLPFNLLKGILNSAIVMLIYKPVVSGLRASGLIPPSSGKKGKVNMGVILVSGAVIITCVLVILAYNHVI